MLLLAASGVAVAVIWIGMWAVPVLRWPRELALPDPPAGAVATDGGAGSPPRVVALVPARDEAAMLPLTLPSLLSQDGLDGVVLVDDGSSDGTAQVAETVAARARHAGGEGGAGAALELLRLGDSGGEGGGRPSGWSGKVHAQARALARALERFGGPDRPGDGIEWLLLVDADIRLRPGALRSLLAVARGEDRDLVTVMARLRTRSFWERLLVPPFVYFFQLLYPFRLVRRDRSPVAAAAGGCVLVRRRALERAGGFEAIGDRLIDDVALARAVKGTGGRLWLGFDPGIESVRPYDTLGELWRMIARNAFVQLGFRWSLLIGALLGLALVFVLPPFGLAAALVLGWAGGEAGARAPATVAGLGFAVAWLLQVSALWPSVRHHRAGWPYAWTLPVAAALYAAMTASSAFAHLRGRTSRWRGRVYRGGGARQRRASSRPGRRSRR